MLTQLHANSLRLKSTLKPVHDRHGDRRARGEVGSEEHRHFRSKCLNPGSLIQTGPYPLQLISTVPETKFTGSFWTIDLSKLSIETTISCTKNCRR
jgi:hypothetical protein